MRTLAAVVALTLAVPALAVLPTTEAYLPAVGHAQGQCVGTPPVCPQWRADAWLFNPSTSTTASVHLDFLLREQANPTPYLTRSLTLAPGQSLALRDLVKSEFGLETYGAVRVRSDAPIVVAGRSYDANVTTSKGTGTAGQYQAALPASSAIGLDESLDIVGLSQGSDWRSNLALMEVTGSEATLKFERIDPTTGSVVGQVRENWVIRGYEPKQINGVLDWLGASGTSDQHLRVTVTAGTGKIVANASLIDNVTGDPATIEMAGHGRDGSYVGRVDKTTYDTPLTLIVAGGRVTHLDATVIVTDEDVTSCSGGELLRIFGPLPTPVALEADGGFSFQVSSSTGGVTVHLQVDGAMSAGGRLSGTATTTVSNAGSCSGTKAWPLVGARLPAS